MKSYLLLLFILLYNFFLISMEQPSGSASMHKATNHAQLESLYKSLQLAPNASCAQILNAYRYELIEKTFNHLADVARTSEDVVTLLAYTLRVTMLKEESYDKRSQHEIFSEEKEIIHALFCKHSQKSKKRNKQQRMREYPTIPTAHLTFSQLLAHDDVFEEDLSLLHTYRGHNFTMPTHYTEANVQPAPDRITPDLMKENEIQDEDKDSSYDPDLYIKSDD